MQWCIFFFFVFVSHGTAARMVVARCSICIICNICVCICITWLNRGMAQGWLLLGAVPGLRNAASQPWSRPWHFGSCSLRTPCDARVVKIQVFVIVFVYWQLQPPYTLWCQSGQNTGVLYFGYFARFWYLLLRANMSQSVFLYELGLNWYISSSFCSK